MVWCRTCVLEACIIGSKSCLVPYKLCKFLNLSYSQYSHMKKEKEIRGKKSNTIVEWKLLNQSSVENQQGKQLWVPLTQRKRNYLKLDLSKWIFLSEYIIHSQLKLKKEQKDIGMFYSKNPLQDRETSIFHRYSSKCCDYAGASPKNEEFFRRHHSSLLYSQIVQHSQTLTLLCFCLGSKN